MRKSNWIIIAVLVLASVFFLGLWYYLDFNLIDDPLDLVITVAWWLVVVAVCVGIHLAEKKRQQRVRTAYVAPEAVFNSEAGIVPLQADQSTVDTLRSMLSALSYSFDQEEAPERLANRFQWVVRSRKFSDDGRTWEGEVVSLQKPDADPVAFSNQEELAALLAPAA